MVMSQVSVITHLIMGRTRGEGGAPYGNHLDGGAGSGGPYDEVISRESSNLGD